MIYYTQEHACLPHCTIETDEEIQYSPEVMWLFAYTAVQAFTASLLLGGAFNLIE